MNRTTISIIVVAAVIIVYVLFIAPLPEKRGPLKERLQMDHTTLMKHERFIQRTKKAGVETEEALKDLEEKEKFIIHSTDKSLAFARLQTRIQNLTSRAGLRISTIKFLPAADHKGYTELPIYVDSTGDISNLSEFLKSLDSGKDFIKINTIDISTAPKGKLRVKMQLAGLMKS
jgi:Tfp pilus assembly protein PilO